MALILASTSPIRRHMLESAGVDHHAVPPRVDESPYKAEGAEPEWIALDLAAAKALVVSGLQADDWVIGSDSIVSVEGVGRCDKPESRADAAEQLRRFSGRVMQLTSAVALVRGGAVDWSFADTATLKVRPLSDAFIEQYLEAEWPEVGYTVGVFRMEARGVQLFDAIDGDHFTILGMPLVPLLRALRERGLIPS